MSVMTASLSAPALAASESMTNESPLVLIVPINIALITMATLVGASAFNFGSIGKKADAPKKGAFGGGGARSSGSQVAKGGNTESTIQVPQIFTTAFGDPDRLAKWEWSSEFISKARPDKGNYGAGDYFDDGLTKLERSQIEQGREAYLTGAAKLRYKR